MRNMRIVLHVQNEGPHGLYNDYMIEAEGTGLAALLKSAKVEKYDVDTYFKTDLPDALDKVLLLAILNVMKKRGMLNEVTEETKVALK
jgi:hypothetical protein